mgnify:CR=1 FL=1
MNRLVVFMFLSVVLGSCTTSKEITRTITKHDTLRVTQRDTLRQTIYHRDSIFFRDSIYTEGTTLIKERWRERWHIRHDTIRAISRDTIYQAKHSIDKARKLVTRHPWYYGLLPLALIACILFAGISLFSRFYK